MLRNNSLPIKSLIVASSWSHLYLLLTAVEFSVCGMTVYSIVQVTVVFLSVEVC